MVGAFAVRAAAVRFEVPHQVFDRILWPNPSDNEGERLVVDAVRRKFAWTPDLG